MQRSLKAPAMEPCSYTRHIMEKNTTILILYTRPLYFESFCFMVGLGFLNCDHHRLVYYRYQMSVYSQLIKKFLF